MSSAAKTPQPFRHAAAPPAGFCLAFTALAAVAGCAGAKPITTTDDPATARWVRNVEITGNRRVSDRQIRSGLATEPRSLFRALRSRVDPYLIERDRARIESFYQHRGYFSARVSKTVIRNVGTRLADVRFVVAEGKPFRITSVSAHGIPSTIRTEARMRRAIGRLRKGQVFQHSRYRAAKAGVLRALGQAGFAHARVGGRVEVDRAAGSVEVRLEAQPGPLVRYGITKVKGARRIPQSAITARLAWNEGDIYDPEALEETQGRLYRLGVFSTVRVEIARAGDPAIADVTIAVSEAPRREVRAGAGVRVDQAHWLLRGRAGYTLLGFGHPLNTLALDARPGFAILRGAQGRAGLTAEASATLRRDDLWFPLLRGDVGVSYAVQELEAYSTQGPGARVGASRQLFFDRLRISTGWQMRLLQVFHVSSAIDDALRRDLGLESPYRLGFFEESVAYDGRDSPVNPKRGFYLELRLEESAAIAGSEFSYTRASPELRAYAAPLGDHLVLAARARLGTVLTGNLPMSQRYFGGGASSHRGFPQRRLSPSVAAAGGGPVPIGGGALLETGAEARYALTRLKGQWLELAGFVDGGDVTWELHGLDLADLHWAVGGGIRYRTFLGPLRFDVGYRLNRTGSGEPLPGDRWAFHFTFGEAF